MTVKPASTILGGANPTDGAVTDCLYIEDGGIGAVIGVPTFQLTWGLCELLPATAYGAPLQWDIIARHFNCKQISGSPGYFFKVPCASNDSRYLGGPGYQFTANGLDFEVTSTKGESSV